MCIATVSRLILRKHLFAEIHYLVAGIVGPSLPQWTCIDAPDDNMHTGHQPLVHMILLYMNLTKPPVV